MDVMVELQESFSVNTGEKKGGGEGLNRGMKKSTIKGVGDYPENRWRP